MRLEEDLGQCWYDKEIQREQIQERDQKYELLLQDFKKLGLENARLKKELKGKVGNPNKRIKLDDDSQKKTKELQKEVEFRKKQIYLVKIVEASSKWKRSTLLTQRNKSKKMDN